MTRHHKQPKPESHPVLQFIRSYFHERGLEIRIFEVSSGLQIQFFPWPPKNQTGNCAVVGKWHDQATGKDVWHVYPSFAPMTFLEAMRIRPKEIHGDLDDALAEVYRLRTQYHTSKGGAS